MSHLREAILRTDVCTLDKERRRITGERERERERERGDAFRGSECVSRNFSRKTFHAPRCARFLVRRTNSDTLVSWFSSQVSLRLVRRTVKFFSVCMLGVSCRSWRTVISHGRRDVIRPVFSVSPFSLVSSCFSFATTGRKRFARANGRKMCECGDECAEDTLNRQLARRPADLRV